MKKETKKAPTIRFRGFTDDWEQRKFDEIASRESSTGMSSEILPSVEYEDVISEVGQLNKDIAEKAVHKKGIKFDKIHVLYGKLRPYLHNWINPRFKGIAVGDWWVLKPVATDKDFLYRLIQTKQFDDIANLSTGSKMPRADWNLVSKSEFMIPGELKEQHLIGQCFSNLDNLITLHQRKLDQLKKLKKYFLQNMFPAKGEKVPRIRFKGFTGDWEQRKLGELATFNKGAGYSKSDLKASGTQIILYGRLYTKYETVIKQVDTFVNSHPGSVYSEGGEVIVPASGETAEDIAIASVVEKPGILLGGDLNIIHPIRNLDSTFLAISISNGEPHKEMAKRAQGKSVVHLHNDDLSQIKFRYPSIEEQSKISKFFSNLDNLITLHQRKLDQLQTMKKFMLQNLFI